MDLLRRYNTDTLDHDADALIAATPTSVDTTPTEVHIATVDLLNELLSLSGGAGDGPAGGLVRMLRRLSPQLLRDFARVPESSVRLFLADLGGRMVAIATEGTTSAGDVPAEQRAG